MSPSAERRRQQDPEGPRERALRIRTNPRAEPAPALMSGHTHRAKLMGTAQNEPVGRAHFSHPSDRAPSSAWSPLPVDGFADVILRDGGTLRLRSPHTTDVEALVGFFDALSERSFYLRFHGVPTIRPSLVEPFLDPDWIEKGALIGTLESDGGETIVALANYVAATRPCSVAEAAFTVADAHQRRGIGTRMLEQLAERAAAVGIERFVAEVMPENNAMLGVFEAAGFSITRVLDHGTIEVAFPIAADRGAISRTSTSATISRVVASLRPFFAPASVAVVGASRRRGVDRRTAVSGNVLDGRVRRRRLSGQPQRRAGCRACARTLDRRAARARRPRGDLPSRRACARGGRVGASRRASARSA